MKSNDVQLKRNDRFYKAAPKTKEDHKKDRKDAKKYLQDIEYVTHPSLIKR